MTDGFYYDLRMYECIQQCVLTNIDDVSEAINKKRENKDKTTSNQ